MARAVRAADRSKRLVKDRTEFEASRRSNQGIREGVRGDIRRIVTDDAGRANHGPAFDV